MSEQNPIRSGIRAGEIVARNVSKSYGAVHFSKEVVQRLLVHDRARQADRDDRPVGLRQEHADPAARRLRAADQRHARPQRPAASTGPARDRLVLFQETALFPWMTTWDNILYGPRARGELTKETIEFAEFLLQKVGLPRFPQEIPDAALGRHAAARRARARHDQQPGSHDPRRAVPRPRRDDQGADVGILLGAVRREPRAPTSSSRPTSTRRFSSPTAC